MKVDLHCHTHFSDGKHSLDFLVQRAILNDVTHLAITDHDCTDALSALPAKPPALNLIKGVEISCAWRQLEVHVVGLFVEPEDEFLKELLSKQQQRRRNRVEQIAGKLSALGNDKLLGHLGSLPCSAVTRSHVADFLVSEGICKSRKRAFKTHLGKRGKIYVAAQWCELEEAISTIRIAGGIPVLAHPGSYPVNRTKLGSLIADFAALGGEAIEVSYPNIEHNTHQQLISMADTEKLYISGGSDFHDAAAQWTDVGKYPPLPESLSSQCIWRHERWLAEYSSQ